MTIKAQFQLPREQFTFLETARANSSVENSGPERIYVTKVLLRFDWQGEYSYYEDASVEVPAGESKVLPGVAFSIDLAASEGSHLCKLGLTYKTLKNNKWSEPESVYLEPGRHIFVNPSPNRKFEVFVSHSNDPADQVLLGECVKSLRLAGFEPVVAERRPRPGFPLWQKILGMIGRSDGFVVLWTTTGSTSGDVREEIGIALGVSRVQDLTMLPIVQRAVEIRGSIGGIEYAEFDPSDERSVRSALESTMRQLISASERKKEKGSLRPASKTE